jgi:hypothetical protein
MRRSKSSKAVQITKQNDMRHDDKQNNNTAQHQGTITHLVLVLVLHQLELFYGKQQTSRRNEMRVIA